MVHDRNREDQYIDESQEEELPPATATKKLVATLNFLLTLVQLFKLDTVYQVNLRDLLLSKLAESASLNGQVFNQIYSSIDPAILTALEQIKSK